MVEFVDDKRVEYDSRFSLCGDGHVLQTIKYETANNGGMDSNVLQHNGGQSLESVYKSPILDINIEIGSETNGYYLGCKDSYREHLFGKDIQAHRWQQQKRFEDRGIKHLYEFHHDCTGDESCDFCNKTTRPFGLENFFVENEEMCCYNSNPNYDSLCAINNERLTTDERNKKGYPSTLIPLPKLYDEQYGKTVHVSELIVDVSTDFVSPSTIQDPAYVSYNEDSIRIKFDQESDLEQVRRCGVLEKLNSIMSGYGFHEDSHTFTTLKYCCRSTRWVGEFYNNFVLDVVKYSLSYAMKKINECIGQVNKFRLIFSPSVVYLLKSLNVLHRSLDVDMELTCIELISEKHGSLLGAMLSERYSLINDAGFNLNCLWTENASSSAIPTDHPTADVHTKADKLQTMVVGFNVLFDVFEILNIELHRKKGNDFYSTCPMCTEGWPMKTECQSVIESIREYIPLNDCLIDFNEDPLRFEHIFPGSIMFVDTQSGNRNFVHGYMMQADISRMSSNCEGFLGDNLSIEGNCKYEEPVLSIVMDADYPKLSISEQGGRFYNGVAHPTFTESGTEFKNFPMSAILSAKANWCMRAITCTKDNIPHLPQQQCLLPRRSLVESRDDWFYEDNLLMKMKNGASVSLLGLLGMSRRRHVNQSLSIIEHIVERFTSNVCHSLDSPKFDDIIAHHAKKKVSHLMRSGNVMPLLYPFDLGDGVFDDCPYDVINNHLRCWNSIDEKVVGVSVATPIFSDGVVDYHPRERGLGFLMCGVPMHMHSKLGDTHNKHYSGFVYHPEQFRMGANRLQYTDLSPSATCVDHIRMHDLIQERKDHRPECYIHSRSTPRNDQLPIMGIKDDNRQKIP